MERRRTTRIWMSLWSSIVWLRFTRQILLSFGTSPQLSFAQGGVFCLFFSWNAWRLKTGFTQLILGGGEVASMLPGGFHHPSWSIMFHVQHCHSTNLQHCLQYRHVLLREDEVCGCDRLRLPECTERLKWLCHAVPCCAMLLIRCRSNTWPFS